MSGQLSTERHGVTCYRTRIRGNSAENIQCRRRNLGHCCTRCGSLSCGRVVARRDTTCCLSSSAINCTVRYCHTAGTVEVCHPLYLFSFAFVFVLLTIFTPYSLPSRKLATAHLLSFSSSLGYTGLLKMTVRVLTTCHTQYTSDSSICIFLFNRTKLQVFVTYLTGAQYVHPL